MADKPHLLYTKPPEGVETFKYSRRGGGGKDKPTDEQKADRTNDFRRIIRTYERDFNIRQDQRNPDIQVPAEIVCVEMTFFGWFDSGDFEIKYRQDFGLLPLKFFDLNTKVLFAVIDSDLFANFLAQLQSYVDTADHAHPAYDKKISYIKDVRFHGTERILQHEIRDGEIAYLSLLNNIELDELTEPSIKAISNYLEDKQVRFVYNPESNEFEVRSINQQQLTEIAQNFDFVHSINSQRYLITRPSRFETNIKEYPFKIVTEDEQLPLIGVVDTGVSSTTPIGSLLVNQDGRYGLNGMDPRVDDADNGYGHGTSVAALAALGPQLSGEISPTLYAQARILSIKVLGDFNGVLSNSELVELIKSAHAEYGVRIFNITICYERPLVTGAAFSDYAFLLDKLAYEHDLLICICTANSKVDDQVAASYPAHFADENTNFCAPADSMNNLVVGALGDNFEPELPILRDKYPLSSKDHPAPYARKFHLDYERLSVKNRNLIKPDVVYPGGNYVIIDHPVLGLTPDSTKEAALQILTASLKDPIYRGVGTSFATPLVANIAANILRQYPDLRMQTVKALIVNSATEVKLGKTFSALKLYHQKFLTGHGRPSFDPAVFSNDDEATVVIEDIIKEGDVKSLPIAFPAYLLRSPADSTVLEIEGTLCFSFLPLKDNHLAYCPINIAFALCKNVALVSEEEVIIKGKKKMVDVGISGGPKDKVAVFDNLWSQDAYASSKMLSNTHKITYRVKRQQLVDERNLFKVAIHCHFHKLLPEYILETLPGEYHLSLVLKIREVSTGEVKSGRLYQELLALNDLKAVHDIYLESENEGEAEAES